MRNLRFRKGKDLCKVKYWVFDRARSSTQASCLWFRTVSTVTFYLFRSHCKNKSFVFSQDLTHTSQKIFPNLLGSQLSPPRPSHSASSQYTILKVHFSYWIKYGPTFKLDHLLSKFDRQPSDWHIVGTGQIMDMNTDFKSQAYVQARRIINVAVIMVKECQI